MDELHSIEIKFGNEHLVVSYYYNEAEKEGAYTKFPAEVEIYNIFNNGTDITNLIVELDGEKNNIWNKIEEKIREEHKNRD